MKEPAARPAAVAVSARLTQALEAVQAKPISLPYPTLGSLFKGRDDVMATLRDRCCPARRPQ